MLNDIPESGTHISIPLAGHSEEKRIAFLLAQLSQMLIMIL